MGIWDVVILIGIGVIISLVCALVGGFLVFKSTRAVPGETFLGKTPKGQVFTIKEAEEAEEFPEEQGVLKRTEDFLKSLGGR